MSFLFYNPTAPWDFSVTSAASGGVEDAFQRIVCGARGIPSFSIDPELVVILLAINDTEEWHRPRADYSAFTRRVLWWLFRLHSAATLHAALSSCQNNQTGKIP
jgi:hypothetical protein